MKRVVLSMAAILSLVSMPAFAADSDKAAPGVQPAQGQPGDASKVAPAKDEKAQGAPAPVPAQPAAPAK